MIVRLDQQINCIKLCEQIQKLINQHKRNEDISNKILSIKIVELVDGGDIHIPKLEHKKA